MDNFSHSDTFKRHVLSLIEYGGMTLEEARQSCRCSDRQNRRLAANGQSLRWFDTFRKGNTPSCHRLVMTDPHCSSHWMEKCTERCCKPGWDSTTNLNSPVREIGPSHPTIIQRHFSRVEKSWKRERWNGSCNQWCSG